MVPRDVDLEYYTYQLSSTLLLLTQVELRFDSQPDSNY